MITLRPIEKGDVLKIYFWLNDLNILEQLSMSKPESLLELYNAFDALENSKNDVAFAICLNGHMIGQADLHGLNEEKVTIGIYIGEKNLWGKGYAVEALKALHEQAFRKLGVTKIFASIRPTNTRSLNCIRKCGYREVGRDSEYVYFEIARG